MKNYGWIRDRGTDRVVDFAAPSIQVTPKKFSWRHSLPPAFDQGPTSSCTGQAVAAAILLDELRAGHPIPVMPSRKFIYWNGRAATASTSTDDGARISDVVDALGTLGYCPEPICPFQDLTFSPSSEAFQVGAHHKMGNRRNIGQNEHAIKQALMAGRVVVAGMLVYESMESEAPAQSGIVPLPGDLEQYLGGHCVCITGWNEEKHSWEVRNSWGQHWGDRGYFWTDYSYFTNPQLASDLTVIW